jgi:hypothetical protein
MKLGLIFSGLVLIGCAHSTPPPEAKEPERPHALHVPAEQKAQMCTSLIEAGINLFADAWANQEAIPKDKFVRDIIREQYREQLFKQGGPQRQYAWCLAKVTALEDFECALAAKSPEDYMRCLPARHKSDTE